MFCINCGNELLDNNKYCASCGCEVGHEKEIKPSGSLEKHVEIFSKPIIIFFLSIVYAYKHFSKNPPNCFIFKTE